MHRVILQSYFPCYNYYFRIIFYYYFNCQRSSPLSVLLWRFEDFQFCTTSCKLESTVQWTPFWVAETKTNFDITDLQESYVYKKKLNLSSFLLIIVIYWKQKCFRMLQKLKTSLCSPWKLVETATVSSYRSMCSWNSASWKLTIFKKSSILDI